MILQAGPDSPQTRAKPGPPVPLFSLADSNMAFWSRLPPLD